MIFTEMRYSEYVAQVALATRLSEHTVENIISVANRVPPSRRREGVAFSIHAEVTKLSPNAQRHWLKVAADENLTKTEFRARLRPGIPPPKTITCPHCGEEIRV
jgi:hypothetical protein